MREIGRRINSFYTTVNFESGSHQSLVLNGLNSLRTKGLLLDVTLIAGGHKFEAHRAVLSACSDYFRAMFTDAMKESQLREIELNGVTHEGMRYLLEYAYTSRLALNLCNIQDVLSSASHVQMHDVVQACSHYLEEQIIIDNCVDLATIAETYSLWQLSKTVYRFICANLLSFSRTIELQRLSVNQLNHILDCDYPVDCSESDILSIVMKWTKYNCNERLQYLQHLLRFINFKQITKEELSQHWSDLQQFLSESMACVIYRKLFSQRDYKSPQDSSVLKNTRGMELAIVKVGGFNNSGVTNEITYYLESEKKWKYLSRIPHVEQCNFGSVVHKNELYVIGGCFNQSLEENVHPFGFRYKPICNDSSNSWSTIAPMQRERCRFTLIAVDNYLYAIGGAGEAEFEELNDEFTSGEIYDPQSDEWTPMASLPIYNRSQHAAVSFKHYIYVSGGLDQDIVLRDLVRYNTLTDEWDTGLAHMLSDRADHTMIAYNHRLYVVGGWFEDALTGMRVLVDTIDCYDIITNSWSIVATIPTPRYHAGIVNMDSILYIIGGFHSDNTFDRASGLIESLNLVDYTWNQTLDNYPQDIWEHHCCTLFVPKHRDDLEVITEKI